MNMGAEKPLSLEVNMILFLILIVISLLINCFMYDLICLIPKNKELLESIPDDLDKNRIYGRYGAFADTIMPISLSRKGKLNPFFNLGIFCISTILTSIMLLFLLVFICMLIQIPLLFLIFVMIIGIPSIVYLFLRLNTHKS